MTWLWLIPVAVAALLATLIWNTRLSDDEDYDPRSDGEGMDTRDERNGK